jgi:dihydrodipicolinate synthase/N-acetylneuraminate lyase
MFRPFDAFGEDRFAGTGETCGILGSCWSVPTFGRHGERTRLIHSARKALDTAGFFDVPIIVGAGGGSTRQPIALCNEVGAAGADAAIVITPRYFASVLVNHRPALKEYFTEVAGKSPVPVLIYNYGVLLNPPEAIHSLMNARTYRSRCQCRN